MELRYLRFNAFNWAMRRFSTRTRRKRMESFLQITRIRPWSKILDLGGSPDIWQSVSLPLNITVLNLPGRVKRTSVSHHHYTYVEGDACNATSFLDGDFDLVFSNSVIEHVGPREKQSEFAREVARLARRAYWVQTPSMWFPIEAHCGMPFWWFYPKFVRQAFLRRWRAKLPAWTDMVSSTRVLTRRQMKHLFPNARVHVEYAYGFPKSYSAYHIGAA